MRVPARALPAVLTLPLLLAGCGGSSTPSAAGPASGSAGTSASTSAPRTSGSAGSSGGSPSGSPSGASSWGQLAGCPSVGRQIPQGANTKQTIDVDGDGRPDTAWIATAPDGNGALPFGIKTASGGVFAATFPSSGSPVPRSVLFADVTGKGQIIALASDGRQVPLFAVSECRLVPEQNVQGEQYTFDLGFTGYGTGVGCADADGDGTRDLLGLKLNTDAQGNPTSVQRTIIRLDGPQARNGKTSTVPASTAQERRAATSVSCGQQTMAADGVSSRG